MKRHPSRVTAVAARLGLSLLAFTGCRDQPTAPERAVEALVEGRGIDEPTAQCAVELLLARGEDPGAVGDGRIDPLEHPEVVEAVAVCAATLATEPGPEAPPGS